MCVIYFVRSEDIEAKPECSKNEEFDRCYAHCEEKCGTNKKCSTTCTPGCRCIYGFAREKSGKCIKHSDCRKYP